MPSPVHSPLALETCSAAAVAIMLAVVLNISVAIEVTVEFKSVVPSRLEDHPGSGRGSNQLLLKSKKHRSDQLHEVKNRTRSRNEQ